MIVVPDAGPLIYLGGADVLGLLRDLYAEVVVPRAVMDEVVVHGAGLAGADAVMAASWLRVEEQEPDAGLLWMLDAGEAAAIPLAERLGATLLVDDQDARGVAEARGLRVIGTLGVLVLAKRRARIDAVAPILQRMEDLGMYVGPGLRAKVLAMAGEDG